ncbi:MAG: response regulator transcription factor [Saprospiraceae bacterium]
MKFSRIILYSALLWTLNVVAAHAQSPDSSAYYMDLLKELARNGNFENAQIEALNFRFYLHRNQAPTPPESIPLLTGIYRVNKDTRSAYQFLAQAEKDALHTTDLELKSALLGHLVRAFEELKDQDRALSNQKAWTAAKEKMATLQLQEETERLQSQVDSLSDHSQRTLEAQDQSFSISRDKAIALGIALIVLLAFLFASNYRAAARWKKRLLHKDIEMDILRANLQANNHPAPFIQEAMDAEELETTGYIPRYGNLEQQALLIEPNRQIVLYLKSLLSDRYQVETASSANEGLQIANNLLPDLIVCDSVLDNQTGIDVVRKIKLNEKTSHIPVILLSERFGKDGQLDALRAGAEDWFPRPVVDTEVNNALGKLLDAQQKEHEDFQRFLNLYYSKSRTDCTNSFVRESVQHIESNLSDPDFTPDELARKMRLNNQVYAKKLIALTGKSPARLLKEMRLEKAKVLLENKAAQPQTIAELVGFSNTGSFAMAFKEYFGENTLLMKGD